MHMFLMGIFWYHLYDMSNYKLCNLDTYNHNFGSSVGTVNFLSVLEVSPNTHGTNKQQSHATMNIQSKKEYKHKA